MKGKKNRVYPELNVGADVKIFGHFGSEQERVGNYSPIIFTVENIENKLG